MLGGDPIQKYLTMPEVVEELKRMKDIGLPITAINLINYLKGMISVIYIGRLGRLELAGGALAVGFTNITGYSVLSGLATGMEPVCSQAFGSRNLPCVISALRRTILLLLLASLPISLLWINLETLMLHLQQDKEISKVAGKYCLFSLPDLIANSLLHPIRIYFRSKGQPQPLMWSSALSLLLHLPLTTLLSSTLHLGIQGVAIATFTTNFTTLLILLVYTLYTKPPPDHFYSPLPPSSPKLVVEWSSLLRLAIPSCLAVCLEWWWYELMTLLSGYLHHPHVTLATAAIVIQTTSLMYTLPTTLSSSVSARVGNELGAGRPTHARVAAKVAMILSFMVSCISLAWTTVGREAWGRVFTGDEEVLQLTKTILPVIGLCELANCPQTTGCGVLRGSARPGIGAAINLYSFYLVGAPVAVLLAFGLDWGFVGLCLGLLAAQVVCAVSIVVVTLRTDWEREACKAMDLVGPSVVIEESPIKPTKAQDDVALLLDISD
ncbi:protein DETOXIFICATION 55 [Dioscorea cayenensis subsp. rotundata]|uniref:Protein DETOXIFICATION n=1 Tax=Dioscorea cayennensis subsp. rotundata TaxID=55577 RepID=A0AB40AGD7_DIOCR|nr:protein DETOXIFICATION 55 [Dioscorea cayenensis subsp. rotundata]